MAYGPDYEIRPRAPGAWPWYIVLCILLAILNFGLVGMGFWMMANEALMVREAQYPPGMAQLYGMTFVVCGVVFGIGNLVLPFLPKSPWIYILHMTNIIAAGLTCLCLPIAIPVFIAWLRPDVREFFSFR